MTFHGLFLLMFEWTERAFQRWWMDGKEPARAQSCVFITGIVGQT
jgi:hypothetical protein